MSVFTTETTQYRGPKPYAEKAIGFFGDYSKGKQPLMKDMDNFINAVSGILTANEDNRNDLTHDLAQREVFNGIVNIVSRLAFNVPSSEVDS